MFWNDSLATGVASIDMQHKELIDRINGLMQAAQERRAKEHIDSVLQFLGDYVVQHFHDEEQLQIQSSYPKYEQHRAIHSAFVGRFNELVEQYNAQGGSLSVILNTNQIVVDWLINHINGEDKLFAAYYRSQTK